MSHDHDHSHDHPHDHSHDGEPRWKHDGVRVITGDKLDPNTAQTPGMFRQAAINHARVGAQKIWAGTVAIEPNAKTGVHHHGELESVIYVVSGKARMRWGERLEFVAEAGPGDFIYVPPFVPHQEINADPDNPLQCVLVRSDNEAVVVNITDVDPVEKPEAVYWVDPIHKHPHGLIWDASLPVELREITAATVRTICGLEVAEEQRENVAPVAVSIAQAHFEPRATFRAIYAGGEPVGFILWRDDDKPNTAYLWRFMVDRRHQGKGYGRAVLEQLFAILKAQGVTTLSASVVRGEHSPLAFYLSIGFIEANEVTSSGEWLILKSL